MIHWHNEQRHTRGQQVFSFTDQNGWRETNVWSGKHRISLQLEKWCDFSAGASKSGLLISMCLLACGFDIWPVWSIYCYIMIGERLQITELSYCTLVSSFCVEVICTIRPVSKEVKNRLTRMQRRQSDLTELIFSCERFSFSSYSLQSILRTLAAFILPELMKWWSSCFL